MATGDDLSRTFKGGHEPFYDFPCSLCGDEDRHVEADSYCEECFVFMCDPCVKSHNRLPLNRQHKLLDKGQFTAVSHPAIKSFPTKRCLTHSGELVNIFCGNHDVVCCSVCKALEHSNCNKTQHLPVAAKGIKMSNEYHNIKKETKVFLSDLNKLQDYRKTDRSRIDKEKQQVKRTIADFRKKANKYLDDLEQKSLNELDLKESSITISLEQDRQFLDNAKKEAEDILQQIDPFSGDNECELFFQLKACKSFIQVSMKRMEDISSTEPESLVFKIDANIEKYLSTVVTLGWFDDTHPVTAQPSSVASDTSTNSAQPPNTNVTTGLASQRLTKDPSGHSDQFKEYEMQLFGEFGVKEKSDKKDCNIVDICQFPDGNILITDDKNKKLKRMNQSYKLLDSVKLPGKPACVCIAGPGEAAVSLCWDTKVQFVSVGKHLSLTRSFRTDSLCRGIVYIHDKLYVCCGGYSSSNPYIKIYDNAGRLLHTLPSALPRLPAIPRFITVSDDAQHLVFTSHGTDYIFMLDLAGNVVIPFSHKKLQAPAGICTDGKGQVFVCGSDSNTVVQFSPKQQKIQAILTQADRVLKPKGVYYDRMTSRLLVSCVDANNLLAYTHM